MKTTKRVFIVLNILNFINKKVIVASFRQSGRRIVIQLPRCLDIAELLIFLINVNNVSFRTIKIEPIFKKLKYLAFTNTALTDENKHHAAINQISYLFCILWTRDKFHI